MSEAKTAGDRKPGYDRKAGYEREVGSDDESGSQRLDKWLWCARFFKSRAIASKLCGEGRLRLDGRVIDKTHALVRVGDVLTFPLGSGIKVVRVLALAARRGPAPEARGLYADLG